MISYPLPDAAIEAALNAVKYDADGLVPAIAQQHDSGEVLMMAWMNRDSIAETLRTGRVCYWSRSRQAFWRKGESSGQVQMLVEWRVDCDGDTLLLRVDQQGPACHTGRRSCFYRRAEAEGLIVTDPVLLSPEALYGSKNQSPSF
ncbi:phosphoribosyl-AMP cyclohydrolase [Niveispirillum sp.]|uniref:phosphoribosyl-AMP cyclohydrolase n=1 Tax=Niveispirillum sp. TaxID=1917217 RepID=UPI001B61F0A0|nr:phosphoribosyl-AMP cyclohydrolase [Niveispirillum sp.]MBP7336411.1 phosphoribosyl-AMP cyclohydrolase [Niveispirillum sp.]